MEANGVVQHDQTENVSQNTGVSPETQIRETTQGMDIALLKCQHIRMFYFWKGVMELR